MTDKRTYFSFTTATVDEIVQHFLDSNRQTVAYAKKKYFDAEDFDVRAKVRLAWFKYKVALAELKVSS